MLIIGISGGSGCGKTTVVKEIIGKLPPGANVSVISQDAYYKDNSHLNREKKLTINFDHPDSIEWPLLLRHLEELIKGNSIEMPTYSYINCSRGKDTIPIKAADILILEGILIFTNQELRNLINIKVFVDTDPDDRLIRIIMRDTEERGRSYLDALRHYEEFVKPMHLQFIEPTKRFADIIIPHGGQNKIAIDLLVSKVLHMI